jgi:hypothetical protein
MVMSERSTVIGVFTDDLNAHLAADELLRMGFSDDEIIVSRLENDGGGLKAGLKRLFKGQETTPVSTVDDFIRMGVPEQDAQYYQSQLDAGRTIVLVRVAGQQSEALAILSRHGALTTPPSSSNAQAQTNPPPVASDM